LHACYWLSVVFLSFLSFLCFVSVSVCCFMGFMPEIKIYIHTYNEQIVTHNKFQPEHIYIEIYLSFLLHKLLAEVFQPVLNKLLLVFSWNIA